MLELPGVYERYVSSESTSQLIAVLRYRCGQTGASVSLLPDFAQPYRLLASELIEDYFSSVPIGFWMSGWGCSRAIARVVRPGMSSLAPLWAFRWGALHRGWVATLRRLSSGWCACGNCLKKVTRTLTKRLKVSTFGRLSMPLELSRKTAARSRAFGQKLICTDPDQ